MGKAAGSRLGQLIAAGAPLMATRTLCLPTEMESQLRSQRRAVDFDTFDIIVQQLLSLLQSKSIDIAPAYQRQFRWDDTRCSQLVESFLLGIPVPSLFMATNSDSTWELVDGVQRLCSLVKFAGPDELIERLGLKGRLQLGGLEKLDTFNGYTFPELPPTMQLQFNLRPVKVVTLSDKSDEVVRFDLFERLNTGGIALTPQEIRGCVFRGEFNEFLSKMAADSDFNKVVRLTATQNADGTREECVLRFFAFYYRYKSFEHSVIGFLNEYMRAASKQFDYQKNEAVFTRTFARLAVVFPNGIVRPTKGRGKTTPLNLFEGVAVGAALALQKGHKLQTPKSPTWLGDDTLRMHTTAATNNITAVTGRIEFCRDRFLGK